MITVSIISGFKAQIVVSATPAGESWSLTGSWAGDEWTVPGGEGVGDGAQLHLTDVLAPLNVPVVYTFRSAAGTEQATPVTIVGPRFLLQSLDGADWVPAELMVGSISLARDVHQALFHVPNRARPAIRYSMTGDGGGALRLRVLRTDRDAFESVVRGGEPILYRGSPPVEDLAPVETILITRLSSDGLPWHTKRDWLLEYVFADYPTLDQRLGGSPWDDFDDAWSGEPWTEFNTRMAGTSWDQFDLTDWLAL